MKKEEEVKNIIKKCLKRLRKNDISLIRNNANERSITHKLAEYIQSEISDDVDLEELDVDCEYNRLYDYTKKIEIPNDLKKPDWYDIDSKTIFPDIIIHKRESDENNFLVIEIKKSSNSNEDAIKLDNLKLKELKNIDGSYKYEHALFLIIDMRGENDDYNFIQ